MQKAEIVEEGIMLTILIANVVLPETAMLIAVTQAHDFADPFNLDLRSNTGPPPPAVCTAQPSIAKATTTATIDLMKKSQRILRG